MLLNIFNNIIKVQRELSKNVKVLALRYLLATCQVKDTWKVNTAIRTIMASIIEDPYDFISEATAEAAVALCKTLLPAKKQIFNKFNENLCLNVSLLYKPIDMSLKEK